MSKRKLGMFKSPRSREADFVVVRVMFARVKPEISSHLLRSVDRCCSLFVLKIGRFPTGRLGHIQRVSETQEQLPEPAVQRGVYRSALPFVFPFFFCQPYHFCFVPRPLFGPARRVARRCRSGSSQAVDLPAT